MNFFWDRKKSLGKWIYRSVVSVSTKGFRRYLSSYETVLEKNKSVDLQRDMISTLISALFMSCLDFALPIPAQTSVE